MSVLHESMNWGRPLQGGRQVERKMFRSFAQLLLPNGDQLAVRTYDLGLDGICVVAPENLRLKSSCEIVFRVPIAGRNSDGIHVSGIVTHSILSRQQDGFMIGLDFRGIRERDLAFVRSYLKA